MFQIILKSLETPKQKYLFLSVNTLRFGAGQIIGHTSFVSDQQGTFEASCVWYS
jgi:hypothetical protein